MYQIGNYHTLEKAFDDTERERLDEERRAADEACSLHVEKVLQDIEKCIRTGLFKEIDDDCIQVSLQVAKDLDCREFSKEALKEKIIQELIAQEHWKMEDIQWRVWTGKAFRQPAMWLPVFPLVICDIRQHWLHAKITLKMKP
jgi:hypothetical protein